MARTLPLLALATAFALAATPAAADSSPHLVIPFGYGWRFRAGPEAGKGPGPGPDYANPFPKNITGMTCTNMYQNPNRFANSDCATACAYNLACRVWQHSDSARQCYHGNSDAVCSSSPSSTATATNAEVFVGGQRDAPPPFNRDYATAAADLDDSGWRVVDAPHDFVVEGDFSPTADSKHGSLPRNVSWLRKHFVLPASANATIWLEFEGVFHYAQFYLNGHFLADHSCGYTGFTLRLDNATGLHVGNGKANVLAVRADASFGSGHWYEGGGIYRPVHLHILDPLHFAHDGVFAHTELTDLSSFAVEAEVERLSGASAAASVDFELFDASGASIGSVRAQAVVSADPQILRATLRTSTPLRLWGVHSPTLYRLQATLKYTSGHVADAANVTIGFRQTKWTADSGFYLNGQHLNFRGFSHHNSMGGVGVALSPRLYLFRGQAARMLGANMWRMSHNPYRPALYSILDRLGVMIWDENRDYGLEYVQEIHDMVKRDRNHAALVVTSFCNEYECNQPDNRTGLAFRAAALGVDPTRPLTANGYTSGLDVQGFSHRPNSTFTQFHQQNPDIPTVLSECCSCTSQRTDRSVVSCEPEQNSPGLLPFVTGSLGVWTLFEYIGEPSGGWPNVYSSFGQFDISGFPKPHAYWYRTNWLGRYPTADPGRPALPELHTCRILELGDQVQGSLSAVTTEPEAELFVDGKSLGRQPSPAQGLAIVWSNLPKPAHSCAFATNLSNIQCHGLQHDKGADDAAACERACCQDTSCNIWQFQQQVGCWRGDVPLSTCTAPKDPGWVGAGNTGEGRFAEARVVAYNAQGQAVANCSLQPPQGQAAGLSLSISVPNEDSGTGSRLLLDGSDQALVGVAVVDAHGRLISTQAMNITFRIESGPGRLDGVSNGDPANHQNNKGDTVASYVGLARVVVQAAIDCATPNRVLATAIDVDSGRRTKIFPDGACPVADIVVSASAPGLPTARISIPTSANADEDGWLAVAERSFALDGPTFLDTFQG